MEDRGYQPREPCPWGPFYFSMFWKRWSTHDGTLNLPRFTMGPLVWLFTTPFFLNSLNASQEITLYQDNQTNLNPPHSSHVKSSSPPSSSSSESIAISSQEPRKNKRKKWRGGKPPTFSSQAGGINFPLLIKLVVPILLRNLRK